MKRNVSEVRKGSSKGRRSATLFSGSISRRDKLSPSERTRIAAAAARARLVQAPVPALAAV